MPDLYQILRYQTSNGHQPFTEWWVALRDRIGASIVKAHVDRMELGHFGKRRWVGDGVWELKITFGPGYRVYYVMDREHVIILLCGGDKGAQDRDIARAKEYATDYWRRV